MDKLLHLRTHYRQKRAVERALQTKLGVQESPADKNTYENLLQTKMSIWETITEEIVHFRTFHSIDSACEYVLQIKIGV